ALWITILGRRLDPILEEMREIGDLDLRQVGLVTCQLLERGCDLIAQTVAKDQRGTNQVGTLLGALRECAMTIDAELGVKLPAPSRGGIIDFLALVGSGLAPQTPTTKRTQRQDGHFSN